MPRPTTPGPISSFTAPQPPQAPELPAPAAAAQVAFQATNHPAVTPPPLSGDLPTAAQSHIPADVLAVVRQALAGAGSDLNVETLTSLRDLPAQALAHIPPETLARLAEALGLHEGDPPVEAGAELPSDLPPEPAPPQPEVHDLGGLQGLPDLETLLAGLPSLGDDGWIV